MINALKQRLLNEIDLYHDKIINWGEMFLQYPELGFCEEKSSELARQIFDEFGISYEYPLALTGVKATLDSGKPGPNVCIIGELDGLVCHEHLYASNDGIAHACGHHAQVAAMLGAMVGLVKSNVISKLCGKISFFAVPAEEFIDLDYRKKLKSQGKITYFSGKQQLIADGAFDDVDIAIMLHAWPDEPSPKVFVQGENLGFLAKTITFYGKSAHGSKPYEGVNALNAAALAILGVHSNRETFCEEDKIRIHPIITKGGDVVNSVPDEVCIDTYVRGASFDAIKKGNSAVERAVTGAAQMVGAQVKTEDMVGYLPLKESVELSEIFEENAKELLGEENVVFGLPITGSSDIGDLSAVIPVIQPSIGGFSGTLHSKEFQVSDPDTAYVTAAKLLAATAIDLLENNAQKFKKIKSAFCPTFTKEEYLNYLQGELLQ